MIWIWIFLVIAVGIFLLALALGLGRAAGRRWEHPEEEEIDEKRAEQLTRPNGNVTKIEKD